MDNTEIGQLPYHIPALLQPTVDALNIQPSGRYADATFGGGGHSRAIMERLGPDGHLYGFDRDIDARANAPQDARFTFVHGDFRYMRNFLDYLGALPVQGIVADLGVSFHHFDEAERGFSFRADAPLDMRMNRHGRLTAAQVVNTYSEEALAELLQLYGEVPGAKRVARALAAARQQAPVDTISRLLATVEPLTDPRRRKKELACIFQALRIEVNGELDALRTFLEQTAQVLKPGGRLAVITYHSLEDRLVKNFMRSGDCSGRVEKDFYGRASVPFEVLTRRAVVPSAGELERNPRSRSAKLRAAVKK